MLNHTTHTDAKQINSVDVVSPQIGGLIPLTTIDFPEHLSAVVFCQGCSWRCSYCHNPHLIPRNVKTDISWHDIKLFLKQRQKFLEGVVFSGGEPLLQMEFLIEFFKKCKERNINTCLDTSGSTFSYEKIKKFDELIKYIDLVMLDIKHIDPIEHQKLVKFELQPVLDFANYLSNRKVNLRIRHVVIPNITLNDEHLIKLGKFLKTITFAEIEVLKYHTMALDKYKKLDMEYPLKDTPDCTSEEALRAKKLLLYVIQN